MKTNFYRPGFWVFVLFFSIHALVYSQGDKFIHIADSTNINGNYTLIDNPNLNGNPDAIFLVTANWNPQGRDYGVYNPSAIGVWYHTGQAKWGIFNQDLSPMPEGAAFNVFIPSGGDYFVHKADSSNIYYVGTFLEHDSLNRNPDAVFFVTQNWNPGGSSGVYNTSPVCAYYDPYNYLWFISNENETLIPEGAAFNVFIPSGTDYFIHKANSSNIAYNYTYLDDPNLNGNPDAIFFVTANCKPVGATDAVLDTSAIGVWYDTRQAKWAIFNQDRSPMPDGAAFNVFLATESVTSIQDNEEPIPDKFTLFQNYPNPFNPVTTIKYALPQKAMVTLTVYNISGNKVATLVNTTQPAGVYEYTFDGSNLSSGIYFVTLRANDHVQVIKMTLLK